MRKRVVTAVVAAVVAGTGACRATASEPSARLEVVFVADEAEAVLDILDAVAEGNAVPAESWARLFDSEGYRRLKAREAAMGRAFTEEEFRAFALSPELVERRAGLRATLAAWRAVPMEDPARLAFAYLPPGSAIRARVYPVIKPRTNSFVFETRTNPAIFLYLDPATHPEQLANTIAHELHHIGLAAACREPPSGLPKGVRDALDWMGGFGEGLAMLAAAGGADTHPHATSPAAERAVWDSAVARVPGDMVRLEAFFQDLLGEAMTEEAATTRGFRFIVEEDVPQGAFYSVGWHMAATIERELGPERVVAGVCDPATLLRDYNRAAEAHRSRTGRRLPLWPDSLLSALPAG